MARYRVHFQTIASTSIEVEAESPEDAIDAAFEDGSFPTLCAQCSGYSYNHGIDLGDDWQLAVRPDQKETDCVEEI